MFIHLVIFIYKYFKFLILILLLRFPSFWDFESFCCSGGHPYTVDISLRYRRYLISALHTQISAESTYAVSAALSAYFLSARLCVAPGLWPSIHALRLPQDGYRPSDPALFDKRIQFDVSINGSTRF